MYIKAILSKLWQKIPLVSFYIHRSLGRLAYLRKIQAKNPFFSFIKPLLFLVQDSKTNKPSNAISRNDVEENISHLMTLARIALEKGDIDRATAILEMGIKICEEYEVYVALPYMYDILASISFALGKMDQAEHLLVSAIEKLIQIGVPAQDGQLVDFQLRLARIYSAYEKNDLAEIGFKDCLYKQERKVIDGDTSTKTGMLYVNVLFWYGLHKIRCEEPKLAKQLITSAYDYSLKIKGLSPYQEMVILYTLADLHMQMGENNLALQNINSAILLGKGIGSTDMPRCHLKRAQIYANLGIWKNAKQSCQEAIKMASLFNDSEVAGEAEYTLQRIEKLEKRS